MFLCGLLIGGLVGFVCGLIGSIDLELSEIKKLMHETKKDR